MGQQRSDQGRMRFADKQHFPSRPWMLAVCRRRMAGLGYCGREERRNVYNVYLGT